MERSKGTPAWSSPDITTKSKADMPDIVVDKYLRVLDEVSSRRVSCNRHNSSASSPPSTSSAPAKPDIKVGMGLEIGTSL